MRDYTLAPLGYRMPAVPEMVFYLAKGDGLPDRGLAIGVLNTAYDLIQAQVETAVQQWREGGNGRAS